MEKNIELALSIIVESKLCVQQCLAQAENVANVWSLPFEERKGANYAYNRLSILLAEIEEFIEENME